MKNITTKIILTVVSIFVMTGTTQTNNKPIFELVQSKKQIYHFKDYNLFSKSNYELVNVPQGSVCLKINYETQKRLLNSKPDNITLSIPFKENKTVVLELVRTNILTDDFTLGVISNESTALINYEGGLHYNGVIKDDKNSLVSISIFINYVMGVISDESGNYNLSPLNDRTKPGNYIIANDRNINFQNSFTCGVDDYDPKFSPSKKIKDNRIIRQSDNTGGTANIYFECDFKMYQDFSSNTDSVMNYVSGFFNVVKTLYQNETVPILISQTFVWTTQDPYLALPTTIRILKRFGATRQNNFNGHLAHLISTRVPNLGGIGWLDVLCYPYSAADSSGPFAYSSIFTTYANFPVYSYTVQVVAHELGHNFASKHTHACVWPIPGGIGALDSCYAVEGVCYMGPPIPRVGTIMSYCVFIAGGSISFTLGFGPRPGDTIRAAYNTAPCVIGLEPISSEIPSEFKLMQNFPNPFNPVTNIRFQIPKSTFVKLTVFDVNGKEIETLINQILNAGTYNYDWDANIYSSGVYFYRIETDPETSSGFTESKKMVLIK